MGARFLDTEEVTGSNPVSPTNGKAVSVTDTAFLVVTDQVVPRRQPSTSGWGAGLTMPVVAVAQLIQGVADRRASARWGRRG